MDYLPAEKFQLKVRGIPLPSIFRAVAKILNPFPLSGSIQYTVSQSQKLPVLDQRSLEALVGDRACAGRGKAQVCSESRHQVTAGTTRDGWKLQFSWQCGLCSIGCPHLLINGECQSLCQVTMSYQCWSLSFLKPPSGDNESTTSPLSGSFTSGPVYFPHTHTFREQTKAPVVAIGFQRSWQTSNIELVGKERLYHF